MAQDSTTWTTFAWRGFRMEVPLQWDLGAFDGDDDIGYLRLDGLYIPRLEIRWKRARPRTSIDNAARVYLDSLSRANRRRNTALTSQPKPLDLTLPDSRDLQVRGYRWKDPQVECVAAVVLCAHCRRVSVLQMFFPPETFSARVYKRVLGSFYDHNPPDQAHWGCYLMHLRTPDTWQMTGHKFNPGYAELNFADRYNFQADFRRWGPASVILQDSDLEEWAKQNWSTGLFPDNITNFERSGEPALLTRRTGSGILAPIRRTIGRGTRIRKALYWQCTAWHCPQSDRLWMVDIFSRSEPQAEDADYQVLCHQMMPAEFTASGKY